MNLLMIFIRLELEENVGFKKIELKKD